MKKPTNLVTITGAAELLERDRATLVRALRGTKPDARDGKRELFKVATIFRSLLTHLLKTSGQGMRSVTDEHTRLARAKAEKAEMEIAEKKGELVRTAIISNLLELEYRTVNERLLVIAPQAADRVEPDDIVKREFCRQVFYDVVDRSAARIISSRSADRANNP